MVPTLGSKCLLDTNVLVAYLNADSQKHDLARLLFKRICDGELVGFVSSQNILELSSVLQNTYKVVGNSIAKDIEKLISGLAVIYPNSKVINVFCNYLKGSKLHVMDLFLMAIVKAHKIDFLISEDKHFKGVKEIKIYNPS